MEKNLPNVYASPINKNINNNKEYYYQAFNERKITSKINIPEKINRIFSSPNHVYKSKVRITTKDNLIDTFIVGKKEQILLTLDGTRININDIIDIAKI